MAVTAPRSDTSPVMAQSAGNATPLTSEAMAVVMVTPADGPSLGTAPSGTWICRSFSLKSFAFSGKRLLTRLTAIWADSFMTSPSLPVV